MVASYPPERKLQRLIDLKLAQNECHIFETFRQRVIEEQERIRLKKATGIDSEEMLDRLLAAGFKAENVFSLSLYPVAMAAWASGSVSEAEADAAQQVVFNSEVSGYSEAVVQFRAWLSSKPNLELWELWEDFTRARASIIGQQRSAELGETIHSVARRVAFASGGFLGFSPVCTAEQEVLDRIQTVYEIDC